MICSLQFSAPHQVKKPLLTKWCLEVSKEAKSSHSPNSFNDLGEQLKDFIPVDKPIKIFDNKLSDDEGLDAANGFEVEQVSTRVEGNFPVDRLNVSGPEFVKSPIVPNNHNQKLKTDKIIEDEDIDEITNPFENTDDLLAILSSGKLNDKEKKDLEDFNLGFHLENFRTSSIDNIFQMQDFADFVNFDHF